MDELDRHFASELAHAALPPLPLDATHATAPSR
jgi:hypothetical protein